MKGRTLWLTLTIVGVLILGLAVQCFPPTGPCSVTYDGNGNTGGSAPVDTASYEEGANATVLGPDTLVRSGYNSFDGWNTASDGTGTTYAAAATLSMGTADVTLYAQWGADASIVGDWYIDDTLDLYMIYPDFATMTITATNTFAADGTVSIGGDASGQTMLGNGVYAYDPAAQTLYVRYDSWEQPVGTPTTPPVQPTNDCVIVVDTLTITMPPGDYMWKDPMIYTRL